MESELSRLIKHCELDEDNPYRVYILMSISRSKNNKDLGITSNKKRQVIHRYVIKKQDDIEKYYKRIKNLCGIDQYNHYIYVSVNPRDTRKAYAEFQKRMADWNKDIMFGQNNIPHKLRNIDKEWMSCLSQPSCRTSDGKVFLIDVDIPDIPEWLVEIINKNDITFIGQYKTKNGWHILTRPFDTRIIDDLNDENISLKKDAQLFIESIEK